jgi:hypothetical protein
LLRTLTTSCTVALILLDVAVGSDVLGFARARVLHHQTLQPTRSSVFRWLNGATHGANGTAATNTARSYLRGNVLIPKPARCTMPVSDSSSGANEKKK